jgi:hypothetical protein
MKELEMRGMQSDASDSPLQCLLGMVLSVADNRVAER